jgi:hypothetical protein
MWFIYYNQQKGRFNLTTKKETVYSNQWAQLNFEPVSEQIQRDFVKYVSLVFDFENRPENPWSYTSDSSHYPAAHFLRDALKRFEKRAKYDEDNQPKEAIKYA